MRNIILLCTLLIIIFPSCTGNNTAVKINSSTSYGNIQNGGYIIKYGDEYIYANPDDYNNLYKSSIYINNSKKLSGGHFFYEMNLCNDEIYYLSSSPGEIWKISLNDFSKKKLVNQKVGNLIVYNNHMIIACRKTMNGENCIAPT